MIPSISMHESLIVLHAGNGVISLPEYLYRVLLFLLAVMVVAIAVRWCLGITETVDLTAATEEDVKEDDN